MHVFVVIGVTNHLPNVSLSFLQRSYATSSSGPSSALRMTIVLVGIALGADLSYRLVVVLIVRAETQGIELVGGHSPFSAGVLRVSCLRSSCRRFGSMRFRARGGGQEQLSSAGHIEAGVYSCRCRS